MTLALPTSLLRAALLAALALATLAARADDVTAKLHLSAQLVVSCRLQASVPRVGTQERASGGASLAVTCTKGAVASAHACRRSCEVAPLPAEFAPTESRVAGARGDGSTVATLLF